MEVSGVAVGPDDLRVMYPLFGMATDLGDLLPRDAIGFRLLTPPSPVGAGGRGGAAAIRLNVALDGDKFPATCSLASDMTLGAVRVAFKVFKVRCCMATRLVRANRFLALRTPKVWRDNYATVLNVNGITNANGATVKATLNKPSKISAQTWMTQFFGLLCLSRGPFGQFAGR